MVCTLKAFDKLCRTSRAFDSDHNGLFLHRISHIFATYVDSGRFGDITGVVMNL